MRMTSSQLLVYLAVKYEGDYVRMLEAIKAKERLVDEEVAFTLQNLRPRYLTIMDGNYPQALRHIYQPPLVLFYYGDISLLEDSQHSVAVIGSRHPSAYGIEVTKAISKELVERHYTIISGLAQGIDGHAHQSAIDHGGKTIAILGSGIDYCYPKDHFPLYMQIKEKHLLLSEYPNLVKPDASHFPMRNRIVAGLSKGVVVTEASERSGTLITVGCALMQGRDVFCVPHLAGEHSSCNRLIKEGAYLVECAQDIIDVLEPMMK